MASKTMLTSLSATASQSCNDMPSKQAPVCFLVSLSGSSGGGKTACLCNVQYLVLQNRARKLTVQRGCVYLKSNE
ncbi:hypothetical protein FA10DRAFT_49508 [Acaromyces ingoldii]|uniref:Uncharacterized protein n=1 Tax=Acaromyces ingoldii TaxID=215250 RepID=A0A316YDA8_9BASI|nr:hypothetical protein FA10DRAFT_49508 [Acaromyces ingoldii]PWN86648.1 hypothetical protein FA10DRAFT_49508 [Acaromyces ingoldii]